PFRPLIGKLQGSPSNYFCNDFGFKHMVCEYDEQDAPSPALSGSASSPATVPVAEPVPDDRQPHYPVAACPNKFHAMRCL
ncbi:MAG: hypothetical protein LBL59_00660, partial [Xanthomonadaceae bacterium]|nr:hypothetical protein [Xanthomonadaceae bacterium]